MVPEAVLPSPPIERDRQTQTQASAFSLTETWLPALVLAGLLSLRIVYACVYRVDSDEPQHLHVVWGWTQGMIQYRDIFDNHSPLFQMLCAPLMRLLGEHAWIVVPMRLAMLPLYIADLALIFLIGRAIYPPRWALWIALVAGFIPKFFLVTTEFRTDDLWTTLWLLTLWLAVAGPLAGRRAFFFGLAMGACFGVSMKTTLLLLSLGAGALGVLALHGLSRRRAPARAVLKSAVLILAGLVVIPALLIGFFSSQGALHPMFYCVIQHNTVPGLGKWAKAGFHQWLFPLSLPVLLGLGWLCMHSSAREEIGAGRALLLITCGAYYYLLRSYWPLVTAQDFIPILPVATLCVLPFLFHLLSLTNSPRRLLIPVASVLLIAACIASIWRSQSPLTNEMSGFEQNLAVVLHLTNPGDFVMDGKGETIFRRRPTYWVLEGVTIKRIQLGLIPNDIRARMIQTGTCVAVNHRIRTEDQDWLRANYLEGDGKVWVAGKNLGPARPVILFHIDIRGRYSIVPEKGKLEGTLDGAPIRETQQIPSGDHKLEIAQGNGEVALVWSQAVERGFNPFTKRTAPAVY